MLAARLVERHDRQPLERLVAPVRILLFAGQHQRDVEAMAVVELASVGDHHPDAAAELQVVDEEGDPHAVASGG